MDGYYSTFETDYNSVVLQIKYYCRMPGLFIFGYMHCGTSLLQQILARHPSIYCERKELKFLEYLPEVKKRFPMLSDPATKKAYTSFCAGVIRHSVRVTQSLDDIPAPNEAEKFTITEKNNDHLAIFFDVFNQLSGAHKYWMEGSPNSVFYHEEIRDRLPDAKFVVIVRDIRDVLASKKKRQKTTNERRYAKPEVLKQKKLEKDFSPVLDSLSWKSAYSICSYLRNHDPNTFTVRYEDLTSRPDEMIKDLCKFLDITYDNSLLTVAFSNAADGRSPSAGIYQNSGNYNKLLTKNEIAVAQTITKRLLKQYAYQLERTTLLHSVASLKDWLGFGLQLLKRLWKRYRLLKKEHFWTFVRFNFSKLRRGILRSGLQHR